MKAKVVLERLATALTCAAMLVPASALGKEPAAPEGRSPVPAEEPKIVDVELGTGGLLSGSLVNAQGQPRASTQVQIFREADLVGEATSNRDGQFQVAGLSGGVHQVRTLQAAWVCRLWAEETAPPGAATRALFVIDSTVVRGQRPLESLLCVDPLLIGAVVATAIAVPVIVHNTRHDRGSGS